MGDSVYLITNLADLDRTLLKILEIFSLFKSGQPESLYTMMNMWSTGWRRSWTCQVHQNNCRKIIGRRTLTSAFSCTKGSCWTRKMERSDLSRGRRPWRWRPEWVAYRVSPTLTEPVKWKWGCSTWGNLARTVHSSGVHARHGWAASWWDQGAGSCWELFTGFKPK